MPEDKFAVDYQRVLITMSLLQNVEDSDYTEKHSLRVGRLVKKLCVELGYDLPRANLVTRSAYFHDVGKIKLPKSVMFKAGRLTDEDFIEMKNHPTYSKEILLSLGLTEEAEIAVQHHERLDGSGYPNGLNKDEISLDARILMVADVFDALTADRPYRKGHNIKDTLLYLYSKAGLHYDVTVIRALHYVLEKDRKIKNTLDI